MLFDINKNIQMLLTGVQVNANLLECFGKVDVSQTYENNTHELLEVDYIFPLSSGDSIVDFSINIAGKRTLVGVLKDKHSAKAEYNTAVENKQVACYLEKQYNGTYKVKVGNIEPGCTIKVKFSYITFLEMRNGKYMFVLPTNIAPKYQLKSIVSIVHDYNTEPEYDCDKENFYKFDVNVTWESRGTIEKLESFTHASSCQFNGTDTSKSLSVEISPLDGDFNLAMTTRTEMYPLVYKFQDSTETYLMLAHKIIDKDVDLQCDTEYVFLVDRSGSMDGTKMTKTCEALELFLRSLPSEKCYFNIVSFGSNYERMFPNCVPYDEVNLTNALSQVKKFSANMGGTELYTPIVDLLQEKSQKRKCYFLLTDGQVSDSDRIAKEISSLKKPGDRFFAMGVGQDAERNLIESTSTAGHGSNSMVVDTDNLNNVVVQLLDDSSKEYYNNMRFTLLFNDGSESKLNDLPDALITKLDYIIPNKQFIAVIKLQNSEASQLSALRINATKVSSQNIPITQDISFESLTDSPFIKQLYGKYFLERLEDTLYNKVSENQIKRIIDTSLEYGLLSKYTAFLVVDQQQVVTKELETMEHHVPHYNESVKMLMDLMPKSMGLMPQSMATSSMPRSIDMMQLSSMSEECDDDCETLECSTIDSPPTPRSSSFGNKVSNKLQQAASSFMNLFNSNRGANTSNVDNNIDDSIDDNDNSKSTVADADKSTVNTTRLRVKILDFQNLNGSFDVCMDLLQLLNITDQQVKELAMQFTTSDELALHIYIL